MSDIGLSITGLQEAQAENAKVIAALKPDGEVGQAIKDLTITGHRFAIQVTHVWKYLGGGLRAAHRMEVKGLRGRIYIDPRAVNPRGQRPAVYGPYENARGGEHAFYDRTQEMLEKDADNVVESKLVKVIG